MSLPTLNAPHYKIDLISNKKTIQYRPFLVKEQKVMLNALQTGERKDILQAMADCVSVCTLDDIGIDKLPVFDLERLFLNIRAKSVGEVLSIQIKCSDCKEYNPVDVNLVTEMKIANADHVSDGKVQIRGDYGFTMRYPSIVDVQKILELVPDANEMDFSFELAKICLVGIYQGEEYVTVVGATDGDLNTVFDALQSSEFKAVEAFFDSMPQICYDVNFTCNKCGHANTVKIEGTDNFFG